MKCKAYIKDGVLFVSFNGSSMIYSELGYPLGDAAMNFSMLPERLARSVFERFRDEFLQSVLNHGTDEVLFDGLKQYVASFSEMNPYFNFYMDTYVMLLLLLKTKKQGIPKLLKSFLFDNSAGLDMRGMDFADVTASSGWAVEVFTEDIKKRQNRLKEDLDAITGTAEDIAELTPMQRLYLLSKQGRNYLSGEFQTTLAPNYPLKPNENDMETIKSTLLDNKVDVVEMVTINNLDDLFSFELYHTLKADLQLRKCKFCGEYFIVRGRIDTEYCDRIKEGETKPCSLIGATRSYWGSKTDNPAYVEFQKAYKRNHSRRRVGKMTQNEFYEWSEEARKKRGECEAGKLPLDEFKLWLGNKR